jgi:hypothetical protein
MKTNDKINELNIKIEKIDGKVLFLLFSVSIQFLLIIILYLKR